MAKKIFKHAYRTKRLSAQEAARYRELRRKIQEEFPPLEPEPDSPILSEPLREAIHHSGKTVRRLVPWIERLAYFSRLPKGLLRPPKKIGQVEELVQIDMRQP